jgi:predicted TIM-barrel fold metal-dependent hydrolase
MHDHQLAFLKLALGRNALRFGQFTLKSGRISPYFFNAGSFDDGASLAVLGQCYAATIVASGLPFDMLFGPAYKGIPLVAATAAALHTHHGLNVPFAFNRKEAKTHGEGGAIVNYVCHSMETTIEPLVQMISSGVLERHPRLRVGMVESGIGFLPWLLETMDYAHKAHHFFVRPQLPELPSDYFRRQCFATFQEDHVGLANVEAYNLIDNVMWANDYPHHEGSWPHSAATVERQMAHLSDDARAKILGLNAARMFNLPVTR